MKIILSPTYYIVFLESNNAVCTSGIAVNYLHGFLRPILDSNRNRNIHFEVDGKFGVEENIQIFDKFLIVLAPTLSPTEHYMSKETVHLDKISVNLSKSLDSGVNLISK